MNSLDHIISGGQPVKQYGPLSMKEQSRPIVCEDGTRLSVQASSHHYSTPRDDDGPYTHVEVGFPTVEPPESWADYFDGRWDTDDRTGSVYGYIPVELVREYIESHGGEKGE